MQGNVWELIWWVEYQSLRLSFAVEVRGDIWSGVCFHFRAWRTLWSFLAGHISGAVWRAWAIEEVEFGRSKSGQTIFEFSGFLTRIPNIKFQHFLSTRDEVSCNSFIASSVVSRDNTEH